MVGSRRRFYWLVVITVYWLCALYLLFWMSPISVDGGGPSVTFYWGNHPPTPTMADYDRNIVTRLPFLYPYWFAASIITFLGCGLTSWLVRLWQPRHSSLFLVSSATTLVSLLLVAAISDIGSADHVWRGPMMYVAVSSFLVGLKVVIPMSILAGLVPLIRDRLMHEQT